MTASDWLSVRRHRLICLLLSAFFSGSETALTASSRAAHACGSQKQGNRERRASSTACWRARERLIGALLLGNNAANIAGLGAGHRRVPRRGSATSACSTPPSVMTVLVFVFAEVLPKTAAFNAPDRMALLVARPMSWVVRLLGPVLAADRMAGAADCCGCSASTVGEDQSILSAHEELRGTVDLMHREGGVEKLDRDMIGGLLDLRELDRRPTSWSTAPR